MSNNLFIYIIESNDSENATVETSPVPVNPQTNVAVTSHAEGWWCTNS